MISDKYARYYDKIIYNYIRFTHNEIEQRLFFESDSD